MVCSRWGLVAACWVGLALPGMAQAGAAKFAFDAVSIKPHKVDDGSISVHTTNDRYSASGVSLANLIVYAYGLDMEEQIAGLSGPLKSARFDIEAKIDAETVDTLKRMEREQRFAKQRAMMKAMLEERFQLKIHLDKKEMPIYSLVVAKGGAKLKQAVLGPDGVAHSGTSIQNGTMTAQQISIMSLARSIEGEVHRVVRDDTGLPGTYDLTLKWTPDDLRDTSAESGAAERAPSLFTALQEQLGLRLESTKGPVDSVVIDHVEMPSEN